MQLVDVTLIISDIPRQTVMTKDNVSIGIDSVTYWHILDPFRARFQVNNVEQTLKERTMNILRDVVGSHELQKIVSNRESVAKEIMALVDAPAASWGVRVESILIKDLRFTAEMQQSLSAAAKQQRIGDSLIISARAELEAAKLQRQSADILSTQTAQQIRSLDALTKMAVGPNTKLIFMPMMETAEEMVRSAQIQLAGQRR